MIWKNHRAPVLTEVMRQMKVRLLSKEMNPHHMMSDLIFDNEDNIGDASTD